MAQVLINIDVADLDQAVAFYTQAFDLAPARRLGAAGIELLGAEAPIYLLCQPPGSRTAGTALRDYARHWTPVHLDFAVDALEPALARVLRAGGVQEGSVREAEWGRIATCADPFGNGLCLIEFSARGYDAIAGDAA
ncbi:VOC family protein [Coralloluteibacterium stylophorae]|uniref:VOC family protein n=1 Tax=Coralloluteibacterium stylophorae TaxID=1776034 RepID=A0AAP2CCJ2_9GAMM|nr:VOC family protein [Coralloluteibacterium stylophorae]MBS7458007.1 VOC family protein [Coralloluteibacterium stylophorae]